MREFEIELTFTVSRHVEVADDWNPSEGLPDSVDPWETKEDAELTEVTYREIVI